MALNASGPISLAGTTTGQSIEIENGGNGTTQISLNDTAVRNLAGVPSGAITMPTNFWGKSNRAALAVTYSSNTTNASIAIGSIGGYVAGKSDVTVTINSGIYVYSTSTGTPGLTITGGTTGDTLTIVNNGFILGQGGKGGDIDNPSYAGYPAGPALSIGFNATINNTNASAYIAGGGGGGAAGGIAGGGGGGAGGGVGGQGSINGALQAGTAGTGGAPGSAGGSGGTVGTAPGGGGGGAGGAAGAHGGSGKNVYDGGGGGGGRVLPGAGGTPSGGGGAGGAGSAVGGNTTSGYAGGGGGGWGAKGGTGSYGYAGGAGGKAINLNGKTVTWVSGDTTRVYGAVS